MCAIQATAKRKPEKVYSAMAIHSSVRPSVRPSVRSFVRSFIHFSALQIYEFPNTQATKRGAQNVRTNPVPTDRLAVLE